jgi:retron-type reverse transcriptase
MKRQNHLFEHIADYQNIRLAFLKTLRGKRSSPRAILFCGNVNENLEAIRGRLNTEPITWGRYTSFTITDPKERVISSAPFADRIIHHAVMNILEPVFERQMIYHTYACRKNKGTHAAVRYAFSRCKSSTWFLKLDMRKYFDSIDHAILKAKIAALIKDKRVLRLLYGIIDSYETRPGVGLPIGNLTSQFFANLYLSSLDHYILEILKPAAYCRYMDDFVLWHGDKQELQTMLETIDRYTREKLHLELKKPVLGKTAQGLPFLGFLIKSGGIYLLRKSKRRMKDGVGAIKQGLADKSLTPESAAARLTSVYAAAALARSRGFRVQLWYGNGSTSGLSGLEPG